MAKTPAVTPPSTPKNCRTLPSVSVFSPRAPIQRATSPRPRHMPTTNMILPTGFDLIVRGVGARKPLSDTVKLLQNAIELIQKDRPELVEIPVVVKRFSTRNDWSPVAYVHLDTCSLPKSTDDESEPRTDLLQCWKEALQAHDSSWEVKWTPMTHGKDKQLWIRFAQFKSDPKDSTYQEKCKNHLLAWAKSNGYPVTNSYSNAGGVTLCMAVPGHVDEILSRGMIDKVAGIPVSVHPIRGRQSRSKTHLNWQSRVYQVIMIWLTSTTCLQTGSSKTSRRTVSLPSLALGPWNLNLKCSFSI